VIGVFDEIFKIYLSSNNSRFVKSMTNVSIIIPTHNRPKCLKSCLENLEPLFLHESRGFTVIVVLDGCKDESWQVVKTYDSKKILPVEGDGSLYWGGAISIGMKIAFEDQNSSAVIWLNDDTVATSQNVLALIKAHEFNTDIIIGSNLLALNLENLPIYDLVQKKEGGLCRVSRLNGNCTLIPRSVYNRLGNIDSQKFPHFADAPYIDKAIKAGFDCFVVENSKVGIHYDIVRHLPICVQILAFKGNFQNFFYLQLFHITSKWFLPYRWYYTVNKYQWKSFFYFPLIFLRDFTLAFFMIPVTFLPRKFKSSIIVWISKYILRIPSIKLTELVFELN